MSKKYLYSVHLHGCEVTFPDGKSKEHVDLQLVVPGTSGMVPAVFTSWKKAVKYRDHMNGLYPANDYFVHTFLPPQ